MFIVRKKQAFDKMTYRWDNHADFRLNLNTAVWWDGCVFCGTAKAAVER